MASRVVIITGGARGIGFACARRFLADGYRVVIADRNDDAAKHALETLDVDESKAVAVHCDVSERLSVHNLLAETLSQYGRVDVVVNNAGVAIEGGALDMKVKDFDMVLDTNLRGAFLVSQAASKYFVERLNEDDDRSGRMDHNFSIINMSSVNAQVALPNYLAYCVAKGGMNQMTKAMAIELAPYGIRVNGVAPGSVKTAMLENVASDDVETIAMRTPLGRLAQADEIAAAVAFLASNDASYMTGETMTVDGGRLALNFVMQKDAE